MNSINGHKIRQRETPNDVWITPKPLAKKQIDMVSASLDADKQENMKMVWYDPFRNSGNYFFQFPEGGDHEWSEILDGRDFLNLTSLLISSVPTHRIVA